MFELFYLTKYVLFQSIGFFIFIAAIIALLLIVFFYLSKRLHLAKKTLLVGTILILGIFLLFFSAKGLPTSLAYPLSLKTFGPSTGPALPLKNALEFFKHLDSFEKVADIARDPNDLPPPLNRNHPETVKVEIEAKEVLAEMAPGITFNYWTFGGKVPGPFIRARQGDTVELTFKNNAANLHHHSIDLHAVNGPGGGAMATIAAPGESKILRFKALNPGLYVYHCAHPNVAAHMAHGMYGLILVEPESGLPKVDKEFYVMQGEFYSAGSLGKKGLQIFDAQKMLDGQPEYIVFNGRTAGLNGKMKAKTGEKIRFFAGNGGVNLVSSFHLIGEIFDKVYPEAAIGAEPPLSNVQTTVIPAGGAAITEFKLDVPGRYVLVDHALARLDRGAWGFMEAEGPPNKEIFDGESAGGAESGH